jgi:hypothetical protein
MSFSEQSDKGNGAVEGSTDSNVGGGSPAGNSTSFDQGDVLAQVGDRKFKTQEDLAKFVNSSQSHISTLEQENAELRKRAEEASKIDSLIERLDNAGSSTNTENRTTEETSQLSMDEVVEQALSKLSTMQEQNQQQAVAKQRLDEAMTKAKEVYGEGYVSKVQQIASDNGISSSEIDQFAIKHPQAFDKLFFSGAKPNVNTASSSQSSVRSNIADFSGKVETPRLNTIRSSKGRRAVLQEMYEKYNL